MPTTPPGGKRRGFGPGQSMSAHFVKIQSPIPTCTAIEGHQRLWEIGAYERWSRLIPRLDILDGALADWCWHLGLFHYWGRSLTLEVVVCSADTNEHPSTGDRLVTAVLRDHAVALSRKPGCDV